MNEKILEDLGNAVIGGKIKEVKPLAQEALAAGIDPRTIIFDCLSKAMAVVGQKYETKDYFLPQVLLSANAMYGALDVVLPKLKVDTQATAPIKVVISVVEGDVHDIGKNIVKAMLTGAGMQLFDLGRDVPIKNIVATAKNENAQVIATSTLMTPTLAGMKDLERILSEDGMKGKVKTIIGGSATSKEYASQIGADAWAYDAVEAVKTITNLVE